MIEQCLRELGLQLPEATPSLYHYVPVIVHRGVAYISGQAPRVDGNIPFMGKIGAEVSIVEARQCAEICVLKGLACLKEAIGSLDHVERILKIKGYVQSAPGFSDQSKVMDASSELSEHVKKMGIHASPSSILIVSGAL